MKEILFVYVILMCLLPAFMWMDTDVLAACFHVDGENARSVTCHSRFPQWDTCRHTAQSQMYLSARSFKNGDTNSHPIQELMHLCFRDVGSVSVNQTNQDFTYTLLLSLPTSAPMYHMRHLDH